MVNKRISSLEGTLNQYVLNSRDFSLRKVATGAGDSKSGMKNQIAMRSRWFLESL